MKTLYLTLLSILLISCGKDFPELSETQYATDWRFAGKKSYTVPNSLEGIHFWDSTVLYVVNGMVRLEGGAVLHIAEGTTILFHENSGIINNHYNQSDIPGKIFARGTKDHPILFSSIQPAPSKGDWNGIHLYGNPNNSMDNATNQFLHCQFEYGGSDPQYTHYTYAMLAVSNTKAEISDCSFKHSSNVGLHNYDSEVSVFNNNVFEDLDYASISINAYDIPGISKSNVFVSPDPILCINGSVWRGPTHNPGATNLFWANHNVPYLFDKTSNDILSFSNVNIEIEKGSVLKFGVSTSLYLSNSTLTCNGTANEPIRFIPSNNYWRGITLNINGSYPVTLNHCQILRCNSSYEGAIVLARDGSQVSISNSEIAYSLGYGIYSNSVNNSSSHPVLSNVYFHDNNKGDKNW